MNTPQQVILVNELDEPVGTMEKMEAHQSPVLHRAFSIFIFNSKGEMLLQQRAKNKYHSGGLWTNACCSHPHPGEDTQGAAARRLTEEMGFSTALKKIFHFTYKSEFENGLAEYEYDHVFAGKYDDVVNPDSREVMDHCYKSLQEIKTCLETDPQKYTAWFHIAFPRIEQWATENLKVTATPPDGLDSNIQGGNMPGS